MTKRENPRRYIAAACFAGLAVISAVSLINNIISGTPSASFVIFTALKIIGCALISVSMFASLPVLTAVGGGLSLLQPIFSTIGYIGILVRHYYYDSPFVFLFFAFSAALTAVFFILIIIAGLNRKSAKALGIAAASVYGVNFVIKIIYNFVISAADGVTVSISLTFWLSYLFAILGAVMLGLALYDMQAGSTAHDSIKFIESYPPARLSDAELFSGDSQLDRLGKAKMQLDSGAISEEEFIERKKNILGL
jgi:hypothetical protein